MKHHRMRPSIKRQQLYGSVELLITADPDSKQRSIARYRLEPSSCPGPSQPSTSQILLENPQEETRWYWRYYLGSEHQNFSGIDPQTKTPFFMSILMEEEPIGNHICRAILWTLQGQRRLRLSISNCNKVLTAKTILQEFPGMRDFNRSLKEIVNAELQRELVLLEDQEGGINCKFGVIYALKSQSSDTQMLSNEHGDENFENFIGLLGQRIELRNWGSFRGGLDTASDSTGRESVYTVFAGHEIMFHVSTMLPYSPDNKQQIERKRHVGNDIVNIVFEAGGDPKRLNFTPTMVRSHFTHVFAVVTYDESNACYRLWIYSEETVPIYGPALPRPNVFHNPQKFRELLLTKLINAEKAAFQAKAFVEKRRNTMDLLIKDMYVEHMKEFNRGGFSKITDNMIQKLRSPVRKDKTKELTDFCKFGELIKLEKLLCGDISRAFKVPGIVRKQLWEPQILTDDSVSWTVIDSDSWNGTDLLLATDDSGVVYVSGGLSIPVIDANVHVQQLAVEENFGVFLARIDKGKESSLIVLQLTNLKSAIHSGQMIRRDSCIEHRIPSTKGCHLFATSKSNGLRLNVIACIGKTLTLLRLKEAPVDCVTRTYLKSAACFSQLRSVSLSEEARLVSIFERDRSFGAVHAAVLMRLTIAIINFDNTNDPNVHCIEFDLPREPICAMRAESDGRIDEIVLCHRNITVTIDAQSNGSCDVQETFWSCALKTFAYRFPFILGFGEDLIEVRLAINGNLLCSMYMPNVRVLSEKNDIIFAADGPSYATKSSTSPELKTRGSFKQRSSSKDKNALRTRWKIYRISGLDVGDQFVEHTDGWYKSVNLVTQIGGMDRRDSTAAAVCAALHNERSAPNSPSMHIDKRT